MRREVADHGSELTDQKIKVSRWLFEIGGWGVVPNVLGGSTINIDLLMLKPLIWPDSRRVTLAFLIYRGTTRECKLKSRVVMES